MENKIKKYVWIGFCSIVAIFHIVFMIMSNNYGMGGTLSVINYFYILSFLTAIVYTLELNKILFYVMLTITSFLFIYGACFSKLF